jgi:hypothetical protein
MYEVWRMMLRIIRGYNGRDACTIESTTQRAISVECLKSSMRYERERKKRSSEGPKGTRACSRLPFQSASRQ